MFIILILAALILIGIIAFLIGKSGKAKVAGEARFREAGPGEPRPKEKRADGLN